MNIQEKNQRSLPDLTQIYRWLPNSRWLGPLAHQQYRPQRIHTDTRTLQKGDLYLALRGRHFDGHDYLLQAKAKGAIAVVAERGIQESGLSGFEVKDTLHALGSIASAWRKQFQVALIAVTGSNGKTTVTQMIAAILQTQLGDASHHTQGNWNNAIGLPLTLLRLHRQHTHSVVELGMNHPGEMDYLANLCSPQVALVNNAQREHQAFMHTVEAVAHENAQVFHALPSDGVCIFPAQTKFTTLWKKLAKQRPVLTFGIEIKADIVASHLSWQRDHWSMYLDTPSGQARLILPLLGEHQVHNALAAIASTLAVGIPLQTCVKALSGFQAITGRSQVFTLPTGTTLVDDTYNANPDSVLAAIKLLAGLPSPRLLVMGDMAEVGQKGEAVHVETGQYAKDCGIEYLLTYGDLVKHSALTGGGTHFTDKDQLEHSILEHLPKVKSILIKGSRSMAMEKIAHTILLATKTKKNEGT
jgi:UDP-N-acetylmuramoyl-tripeptide--D-alanyl-D-alanine ligase